MAADCSCSVGTVSDVSGGRSVTENMVDIATSRHRDRCVLCAMCAEMLTQCSDTGRERTTLEVGLMVHGTFFTRYRCVQRPPQCWRVFLRQFWQWLPFSAGLQRSRQPRVRTLIHGAVHARCSNCTDSKSEARSFEHSAKRCLLCQPRPGLDIGSAPAPFLPVCICGASTCAV